MGAKLSEETVRNLAKPAAGNRVTYFAGDTVQGATAPRGFGVRVTASGARAFVLNYRVGGRERRYTIGLSPDWSVLKAIRVARELRQRVDRDEDPVAERRAGRVPSAKAKTVADVLDDFLAKHVRKGGLRSADNIESTIKRLIKPEIGEIGIFDLRRSAITGMLNKIADTKGPVAADRTLACIRKALGWFAVNGEGADDFTSPIVRGMARTRPKERARTRVLAHDEIKDLWTALAAMALPDPPKPGRRPPAPSPFPAIVRTLLLTGQRRDEVAAMRWDEIDGKIWIIPAARYKTKLDHLVPLSDAAVAEIGTKAEKAGPYVFSTTKGKKPFSGYSKAKATLDAKILEARERDGREPMPEWRLHDLRRTCRSLMSRLKIEGELAERVLGHLPPGVRGVYDRHDYQDEKAEALATFAVGLARILNPPAGNVVEFTGEAA